MRKPNVLEPSDIAGLLRRFAARRYHGTPYDDPHRLQLEVIRRLRGVVGCFALAGASYAEVGCVLRRNDTMLVLRLAGHALGDPSKPRVRATLTFDGGENYGIKQVIFGTESHPNELRAVSLSYTPAYYESLQDDLEEGRPRRTHISTHDEVRGLARRGLMNRLLDVLINGEPDIDARQRWAEHANNGDRPEWVQAVNLCGGASV